MQYNGNKELIIDSNSIFELSILSTIGDRKEQQDSFGYSLKQNEGIIVICDGMGGYEGGKVASMLVTQAMLDYYEQIEDGKMSETDMIKSVQAVDEQVIALSDEAGRVLRAGSTMVSVVIQGNKLSWCSVGDSRAYLYRKSEYVQFTQDQNYKTVLDEQLRVNLITEEEYEKECVRGEALISYVGIGNLSLIDYSTTPIQLKKDDKLILMSDGLYKLLTNEEIFRIIENFSNINEALEVLEHKVERKSKKLKISRDNMTVAIIKITEEVL